MPYEFYKILHLTGLVLLFSGLVSLLTLKAIGAEVNGAAKKFSFIAHGIGLFLILLSGFGLLARLGPCAGTSGLDLHQTRDLALFRGFNRSDKKKRPNRLDYVSAYALDFYCIGLPRCK